MSVVTQPFIPPDVSRPPFLPALEIVVDLPMPPSVNRIWIHAKAGQSRVSRSREYVRWINEADMHSIFTRQLRGVRMIQGKFEADITLKRCAGDLDNRIKGILDWAQSRHLILNDKHCERLTVAWGHAPAGCRLILRPVELRA